MADRFQNLPGLPISLEDGNLVPDRAPAGPTVAIIGSATKGPAEVETTVFSAPAAIARFGNEGSLGRGLAEAFQGGASSAVGLRLFAKAGKLEHIGDVAATAGITVEPVLKGADSLDSYSILYNQQLDELKIYSTATGVLVYSKTGEVVDVDDGSVVVTGEAVNDEGVTNQVFGSIGLHLVVADTETDQLAAIDVGTHTIFTFGAGIAGINLGKLQFVSDEATPIMVQIRSQDDSVLIEERISAVNVASRTVTLVAAVDAAYYTEGGGGDGVAAVIGAAQAHDIRFISLSQPIPMSEVTATRLIRVTPATTTELLVTPGANYNGLALLVNDDGVAADTAEEEVEPHKMNLYEGLLEAARVFEASDIDYLVLMDAYLDDPALDGQTAGETKLPTTEATGLIFDSAVNGSAGIDSVATTTIAGFGNRIRFVLADEAERDLATSKLEAAGRGQCWIVYSTPQGATFGEFLESDELVRTARILNWENFDTNELVLHFDRDVSFSLTAADAAIEGALAPAFKVYSTDLLLFYRNKEVNGALRHMWYTSKADPEGNTYHEVNFAYKLGYVCHDLSENEVGVLGVMGVRPPANHFNLASIAAWIGDAPEYDEDGDVSLNGSGLLGNKFIAGRGLNNVYVDANQFDPGFKATLSGELDDPELELDSNDFEKDLGKYLSIVASWPVMTNASDSTGAGYIASGAALYAGMLAGLAPWQGSTAKAIGGRNVRLPVKVAKRHLNELVGARYVMFTGTPVTVVDGPTSALPTSDFTRNMTMRLVNEVIRRLRAAAKPYLGDVLTAIAKSSLDTALKKSLAEVQRLSEGALEQFVVGITQTPTDKARGTARVTLTLRIINELRRLTFEVALTL